MALPSLPRVAVASLPHQKSDGATPTKRDAVHGRVSLPSTQSPMHQKSSLADISDDGVYDTLSEKFDVQRRHSISEQRKVRQSLVDDLSQRRKTTEESPTSAREKQRASLQKAKTQQFMSKLKQKSTTSQADQKGDPVNLYHADETAFSQLTIPEGIEEGTRPRKSVQMDFSVTEVELQPELPQTTRKSRNRPIRRSMTITVDAKTLAEGGEKRFGEESGAGRASRKTSPLEEMPSHRRGSLDEQLMRRSHENVEESGLEDEFDDLVLSDLGPLAHLPSAHAEHAQDSDGEGQDDTSHRWTSKLSSAMDPEEEDAVVCDEHVIPKQLTAAILGLIFHDLIEFNGVNYQPVPLTLFREKYIGLYFAVEASERCEQFTESLRVYHTQITHKMEIVLVCCDHEELAWRRHTQHTSWPTYPKGDYRPSILRRFFHVKEYPKLVMIDPNGFILTTNVIEKLLDSTASFPYVDDEIEYIYGDRLRGRMHDILEAMALPDYKGRPVKEHDVVILLFGEPWCPETKDLARRLVYLLEHLQPRQHRAGGNEQEQSSRGNLVRGGISVCHVHCDELELFTLFNDYSIPLPSCRIADKKRFKSYLHFFQNHSKVPTICLCSPEVGWIVPDGAAWIQRDPTGVCFPWLHKDVIASRSLIQERKAHLGAASTPALPFYDVFRELTEEHVHEVLQDGPVFIAFLNGVNSKRSDVIVMLRAVATSYFSRVEEKDTDLSTDSINMFRDINKESDVFGTILQSTVMPTRNSRLPKLGDTATSLESRMLYKVLQKSLDKQKFTLHGSAPWNNPGQMEWMAHRKGLNFFYCHRESRVVQLISRYCCLDSSLLQAKEDWNLNQSQRDADANNENRKLKSEVHQSRIEDCIKSPAAQALNVGTSINELTFSAVTSGIGGGMSKYAAQQKKTCFAGDNVYRPQTTMTRGAEFIAELATSRAVEEMDIEEDSDSDFEMMKPNQGIQKSRHHTRTTYQPANKFTRSLWGDGNQSNGIGLIVDLPRGCYYYCGHLMDHETVFKFLDGWYDDKIDPFDLGFHNMSELDLPEKDDVNPTMRALNALKPQPMPLAMPESHPKIMPCIVIWVPTARHGQNPMGAAGLYRAFLNFAVRASPREDWDVVESMLNRSQYTELKGVFDCEHQPSQRLVPVIEKFWTFVLNSTVDKDSDSEFGGTSSDEEVATKPLQPSHSLWQPPGVAFEHDIRHLFAQLGRKSEEVSRRKGREEGSVFTAALDDLRNTSRNDKQNIVHNTSNLVLRVENTRSALYASMLDELTYHLVVQCPPPPLFVLFVGDLPSGEELPWPEALKCAHVHAIGDVKKVRSYQDGPIPRLIVTEWDRWIRTIADDKISNQVSRHILVPWTAYSLHG